MGRRHLRRRSRWVHQAVRPQPRHRLDRERDVLAVTISWAPPTLVSPTTITLTNTSGGRKAIMDPTKDYIVVMPSSPITVAGGVELNGGRNVVLIGGGIKFAAPLVLARPQF